MARRAAFDLDTLLTFDHVPEAQRALWSIPPGGERPIFAGAEQDAPPAVAGLAPPHPPPAAPPPATQALAAPPPAAMAASEGDDGGGFWNELELSELVALRRHRFKIAAAEQELGLSSKSRTLTNHLRGMSMKAAVYCDFDIPTAARLVVGRDDEALQDRMRDRIEGYLEMVRQHVATHSTRLLFNNLPRDYRKFVERAIERHRSRRGEQAEPQTPR